MTTLTFVELSRHVAKLYGIDAKRELIVDATTYILSTGSEGAEVLWLHEDSARCFELMVEYGVNLNWYESAVSGSELDSAIYLENDDPESVRTAILQCLAKMKEQS
jgi:hypothetical protein